ncbi:nucleotidyltransferase family protein [Algoriphagus boritolerans]|uniref:Nucleotidyltransferase domain-containing protein n=1 Tax=Algoriphagus boritolerans DSM 17298 = JCM 18970 TaxID=1120964 RepID=A0A1H5S552_9BACT|nr:nucleotidyltransferase domain-containing protein [Algoriphagus boritolerans]SEF44947.1 Nucleotidyltransferase domain-containing protein [Algoriphagus boritolerans DSM 17298 = JCM 18970]
METFGLTDKSFQILLEIFRNYPTISEVKVYGSRAKGTYSERSDLDLVILDELDRKTLGEIWMDINSSDFPLTVDLQVYGEIKNENLKKQIHRVGKIFYVAKGNLV